MTSAEYWKQRALTDKIVTLNAAKKQIIALRKIFRGAQGELAAESEKILHSISGDTAEARRILSIAELSGLRNKYARMIEMLHDDKTAQMANRLMDTIYKTNRVTRMDAMTTQLDYYCAQLYGNSANVIKRLLVDTAQTSYLRKAFDFEQFAGHELSWAMIDAQRIDVLIASRWSGKNWSNRLWGHVKGFDAKLKDIIGRGIFTGEDTHVMAAELSKITNSTRNNAERIMRTETAFVAERAAQLAYDEFDVEKYQYLATLDIKTSEVCRDMDGRVFAREKAKTGINFPPLHPNCRSTTVPEFDDMDNDDMRAARDPVTGKTVYEKDMSYNDWYEKRVARRMEMPRSVGMPLKNRADEVTIAKNFAQLVEYGSDDLVNDVFDDKKYRELAKQADINLQRITEGGNISYFSPTQWKINLKSGLLLDYGYERTIRHEVGHLVFHEYFGANTAIKEEFRKALLLDKQWILKNKAQLNNMLKGNNWELYHAISDIADGLTNGKVTGYHRHDREYWSKRGQLVNEAFAHQFDLFGSGNNMQARVMFSKCFRNANKVFLEMISSL